MARQGSNGSFGLWSAGGDDAWLDAYVTDFLTRAREKGFAVPDVLFKNALDRIRNSVVNANEPEKDGGRDLAYGLYVLARNGTAPIGDLRYLADTKLNNLATPIAKSQLAAALGLPYAFASHFAPGLLDHAAETYRRNFRPSAALEAPWFMAGYNVFAADTDEEAELLASSQQQAFVAIRTGEAGRRPSRASTQSVPIAAWEHISIS